MEGFQPEYFDYVVYPEVRKLSGGRDWILMSMNAEACASTVLHRLLTQSICVQKPTRELHGVYIGAMLRQQQTV